MENVLKIVDNELKKHGVERSVPRRIGEIAKWGIKCDKDDDHFQDKLTDWIDRVLPTGFTFGVERIYSTGVVFLIVKKVGE